MSAAHPLVDTVLRGRNKQGEKNWISAFQIACRKWQTILGIMKSRGFLFRRRTACFLSKHTVMQAQVREVARNRARASFRRKREAQRPSQELPTLKRSASLSGECASITLHLDYVQRLQLLSDCATSSHRWQRSFIALCHATAPNFPGNST